LTRHCLFLTSKCILTEVCLGRRYEALIFNILQDICFDTRYHSWLRQYATSRKVAGSIPDEAIGFFNRPNPSSRTRALGSTLTEKSTRNLPGGKGWPAGA
jgi:hypothetical protein